LQYADTFTNNHFNLTLVLTELRLLQSCSEFGPQSCAIAQVWAAKECQCTGPPITPPPIISASACSLCPFPDMIFGLPEKLVIVPGIGEWPCQDLFDGGAQGYFTGAQCRSFRASVSEECGCRNQVPSPAPSLVDKFVPTLPPPPPAPVRAPVPAPVNLPTASNQCALLGAACANGNDCCSNRCDRVSGQRVCTAKNAPTSSQKRKKLGGCKGGSRSGC